MTVLEEIQDAIESHARVKKPDYLRISRRLNAKILSETNPPFEANVVGENKTLMGYPLKVGNLKDADKDLEFCYQASLPSLRDRTHIKPVVEDEPQ